MTYRCSLLLLLLLLRAEMNADVGRTVQQEVGAFEIGWHGDISSPTLRQNEINMRQFYCTSGSFPNKMVLS